MTLVNARAAFEKAVTDAVAAADATVLMKYDNVAFTTPGRTEIHFDDGQFWAIHASKPRRSSGLLFGTIQCNVYVPKSAGTSVLSAISESVIDALQLMPGYADTFSSSLVCLTLLVLRLDIEDRSHFVG